jgi:(1->4)-alpha-D-glucan 1-alpha-D-glucosylmutase
VTLRVPLSTYRIQFNAAFTLDHARQIVAYLRDLGISDLYASPLLRARKGSTHGYDVVDATALNPELGTPDDLTALHEELERNSMGLLLDIVPNHMAASDENAWWMSVLENGAQSRYLHYFDIDWRDNKVLLPILGRPYGEALESGEIQLEFDHDGFFLKYYDKRLPLAPQSYPVVLRETLAALPAEGPAMEVRDLVQNDAVIANSRFLKDTLWRVREQAPEFRTAIEKVVEHFNGNPDLLDSLLDAQAYRLAYWRIAAETINYRRFFDVTDLVGVRIENPEVFELHNKLVLELMSAGKVTALRIDHIDGLYDPVNYLTRLQLRSGDPVPESTLYVAVEKILEAGESLPPSFRCAGTSGYDFLDTVNVVFVDPAGLGALTTIYRDYTGLTASYEDVVYERKKQVIEQLFYGEMRALGAHLGRLAVADRNARDFAPTELLAALVEVTACMPVYRTYVREAPVGSDDRAHIESAVADARRRAQGVDAPRIFDFVANVLLLDPPQYISSERDKWLELVMRWQQFTGPVMAKGVEDTSFYNYNRLLSLNEVGGEPGRGSDFDPVAELHERNARMARDWPHTMNATSTHDTKRSEDVRARIHVLSELPEEWQQAVQEWTRVNAPLKKNGVPHPNEEWMLYQTLVGMWPLDPAEESTVPERLRAFLEKAAREAKTHSSWLSPNEEYEKSLQDFATAILEHQPFMDSFRPFQQRIAFHGFLNSLSQVVLKTCSSGLPDFYQGSELWDFSLVDPDNRRPVDYGRRTSMLRSLAPPAALLEQWQDGAIKLFVTARTLAARARHVDAFRGAYRAVATGTDHAVAFTRGDDVLVAVPRLTTRFGNVAPLGDVWGDAALDVGGRWRNVFTDEIVEGGRLALRDVFATFPVAVFERA